MTGKTKIKSRDDSRGDKVAASLSILRGAEMTTKGRKQIAGWLRRQADFLEKKGDQMATRFTARWRYSEHPRIAIYDSKL